MKKGMSTQVIAIIVALVIAIGVLGFYAWLVVQGQTISNPLLQSGKQASEDISQQIQNLEQQQE